jgi:PAS domain S-box-containing protein
MAAMPVPLSKHPTSLAPATLMDQARARLAALVDSSRDELRAWLASIVDSSDDAIVSKTLEGIITSWNRGAERIFGYTAAEAIGQSITLIIPEDRWAEEHEVLARLRRGERVDHFETVRRTKGGRQVQISLTVSPVRDARGTMIGASKVARDITERVVAQQALRRARDELEDRVRERTAELSSANESLRLEIRERQRVEQERSQLLTRLIIAQEDERRRIARELHDQLGQQLTALRLTLETFKQQSAGGDAVRVEVETLQELARQLDQDVAFRVWELHPTSISDLGLRAALTRYVHAWSKQFDIPARLHTGAGTDERHPPDVETTVYRLAQEALNNVAKHARARSVDVVLECRPGCLTLVIEDNGVGFDLSDVTSNGGGRLGLIGMRERAALIGADLQIESTPGHGTTVILRVPASVGAVNQA